MKGDRNYNEQWMKFVRNGKENGRKVIETIMNNGWKVLEMVRKMDERIMNNGWKVLEMLSRRRKSKTDQTISSLVRQQTVLKNGRGWLSIGKAPVVRDNIDWLLGNCPKFYERVHKRKKEKKKDFGLGMVHGPFVSERSWETKHHLA